VRAMGGIFNSMFSVVTRWKLATFVVLLFFSSSNAETQSRSYFGRTTDPTPVDVAIQDKNEIVHFTIPKVFMTFSKNWEGGLQSGITLEVIYPSMAALSASRSTMIGSDVVVINLQSLAYTGADTRISKLLSIMTTKQWTFVEDVADSKGRSYRSYVNKRDVEKKDNESSLLPEFFVPHVSDVDDVYFECLRERSNPLVGCSEFVNYGQTLLLRIQFKRSQFEKWPEIRDAVIRLLDAFRQSTGPQR
jgi:hypothetical protein